MKYTVVVLDESGAEVRRTIVSDTPGTNAERLGINGVDAALLAAAPECCPYDCDSCNAP